MHFVAYYNHSYFVHIYYTGITLLQKCLPNTNSRLKRNPFLVTSIRNAI